MATTSSNIILFPINQDEQAKQTKADYLLAQDVYQKITCLLERALKKIRSIKSLQNLDELDDHRAHEAILLQGARGTGKSAILVNLGLYLKEKTEIANQLLILKPIDPTLLEDDDDMFLNLFIVALVRDKQVKAKLDLGGRDAEDFYDQLCKLGSALESSETKQEQHGMDRVRALIGSSDIGDKVHKLFQSALKLTGKELIVMAIDDVDTSLQHAYNKMEIVRKYLVSPFVVPIISGDLALYDDVIWRKFHGRLLTNSNVKSDEAILRAQQLSNDYQRKVLPLPRRIAVRMLDEYLDDENVILVDNDKNDEKLVSIPVFKLWLEAVLNERVNGVEHSYLRLPIHSMREFAQLVSHVRTLLADFPPSLRYDKIIDISLCEMRRFVFMKSEVADEISIFSEKIAAVRDIEKQDDRTTETGKAYQELKAAIGKLSINLGGTPVKSVIAFQEMLKSYFQHHQEGGKVYLVLEANCHFHKCAEEYAKSGTSPLIFETDLFRPIAHHKYLQFSKTSNIKQEWTTHLKDRAPSVLITKLPEDSIVSYPRPEIGHEIHGAGTPVERDSSDSADQRDREDMELVRRLMVHSNFYHLQASAALVSTGRIFEFLILSLIRNITVNDVLDMIDRAPFYSLTALASTKTFKLSDNHDKLKENNENSDYLVGDTLNVLIAKINAWRAENAEDLSSPPSSWLIYNVFNKYFNQADFFKIPKLIKRANKNVPAALFGLALQSFNAIWATFGAFEKGPIFGLDKMVATVNIGGTGANFSNSQLYIHNIQPFCWHPEVPAEVTTEVPAKVPAEVSADKVAELAGTSVNFHTGAYTFLLESHPLNELLRRVFKSARTYPAKPTKP